MGALKYKYINELLVRLGYDLSKIDFDRLIPALRNGRIYPFGGDSEMRVRSVVDRFYGGGGDEPVVKDSNFHFEILSDGEFGLVRGGSSTWLTIKPIKYKINDGGWKTLPLDSTISASAGDKIYWQGFNERYGSDNNPAENGNYWCFEGTGQFNACGNVMELIGGKDTELKALSEGAFNGLFRTCVGLVSIENLLLPATEIGNFAYCQMFNRCYSLVKLFNSLDAKVLPYYACWQMFQDCTSLVDVSNLDLSDTTCSGQRCCQSMFGGCTRLEKGPEKLSDSLSEYCYSDFFNGCTSFETAPELPAGSSAEYCYDYMFCHCRGMKSIDIGLVDLRQNCMRRMMYDCVGINHIITHFYNYKASDFANRYASGWVYGVSSNGTFEKSSLQTYDLYSGADGVPGGWTIVINNE